MAEPPIPKKFEELAIEEQIEYVHRLWDRIASNAGELPVPDWHREVVSDRVRAHQENPDRAAPWPEVRAQIEDALRRRRG